MLYGNDVRFRITLLSYYMKELLSLNTVIRLFRISMYLKKTDRMLKENNILMFSVIACVTENPSVAINSVNLFSFRNYLIQI